MGQFSRITTGFASVRNISLIITVSALAGCSAPSVSDLAKSDIFSLARLSAAIMGDGTEGREQCNRLENLLRNGRSFCEKAQPESLASDQNNTLILSTLTGQADTFTLQPDVLGFVPVDRRAAADFSLEIARKQHSGIDAPMLSFGMLSANYGPSVGYELKLRNTTAPQDRVAMTGSLR